MTLVIAQPSEAQVRKEIRAMRQAGKKLRKSPAKLRAFMIKHGFITKDGKLHPRYR